MLVTLTPPPYVVQTIGVAPHERGPAVFLDYDQAELDAAYDQAVYAPNREIVNRRNLANSAAARTRIGDPERLTYGPSPVEHLDLFRTSRPNAPVFVFIHGGAWRSTGIDRYAFAAEPFVNAGAHVVLLQFTGVEEAGGSLLVLADQVRRGVAWAYRNAASFGGDPSRLYVGGHSSGAHLTSTVLITDWEPYGVPNDLLKGALCCSGMYDLAPVALSKRSSYVTFDEATIDGLSAMRHLERIRVPVFVAFGTCETPEFQRQNRDFATALEGIGKSAGLAVGEGYNHFEMAETLGNPNGLLGGAVLRLMGLERPGRGGATSLEVARDS